MARLTAAQTVWRHHLKPLLALDRESACRKEPLILEYLGSIRLERDTIPPDELGLPRHAEVLNGNAEHDP